MNSPLSDRLSSSSYTGDSSSPTQSTRSMNANASTTTSATASSLNSLSEEEDVFDPLFASPTPNSVRRLIVIDGCNVARSACGPSRDNVNCAGLMAVIRWLLVRKFEVVAFLPIIYNNNGNFNATNVHLLQKLEQLGVMTFTPARTARGERRAFINYDDLYVANLAARHGGMVLSGDRFKDILAMPQYNELHEVLTRRLNVRFHLLKHHYVQIGEDRFIDRVPELFLSWGHRSDLSELIRTRMWAEPCDSDYQKVLHRRKTWSSRQADRVVATIDLMMDELCERAAIRPIKLELPYQQWIVERWDSGSEGREIEILVPGESPGASITPATSSSQFSEDSFVSSWNENPFSSIDQLQQQEKIEPVTEDGYSTVVPGLWIPPELRHLPISDHQHLQPRRGSNQQSFLLASMPPSPQRLKWKDVDVLSLTVADLNYCLNHPKNDLLALSSITRQHPGKVIDENHDHILAQLIDASAGYIVEKVLRKNVSRNVEVLANLCAEMVV